MKLFLRLWMLAAWVALMAAAAALSSPALAFRPQSTASSPGPTPGPTLARALAPFQSGFVRGAYGKDSSPSGSDVMAATGFNTVMTDPYREFLDPLAAKGLKGVVWLGAWLNAPTCGFERDDAIITSQVAPIAGHPAIQAYYLGDEPRVSECPGAPALFKKRSDLVHSLDPSSATFTVIQAYENGITRDYAPWAGVVDIVGFDVYPCARASSTCDFGTIDSAITSIERAGIGRYWAIMGDFQDCYYRLPTPEELRSEFDHWARSNMAGYFVFSWNYQSRDSSCVGTTLDRHPENLAELKYENTRAFTPSLGGPAQSIPTPAPGAAHGGIVYVLSAFLALLVAAAVLLCIGAIALKARRRSR